MKRPREYSAVLEELQWDRYSHDLERHTNTIYRDVKGAKSPEQSHTAKHVLCERLGWSRSDPRLATLAVHTGPGRTERPRWYPAEPMTCDIVCTVGEENTVVLVFSARRDEAYGYGPDGDLKNWIRSSPGVDPAEVWWPFRSVEIPDEILLRIVECAVLHELNAQSNGQWGEHANSAVSDLSNYSLVSKHWNHALKNSCCSGLSLERIASHPVMYRELVHATFSPQPEDLRGVDLWGKFMQLNPVGRYRNLRRIAEKINHAGDVHVIHSKHMLAFKQAVAAEAVRLLIDYSNAVSGKELLPCENSENTPVHLVWFAGRRSVVRSVRSGDTSVYFEYLLTHTPDESVSAYGQLRAIQVNECGTFRTHTISIEDHEHCLNALQKIRDVVSEHSYSPRSYQDLEEENLLCLDDL